MVSLMFPIYFLSLVISAGLTLLSAYQVLALSDMDCEYINPQRCCFNLNRLVVPELLGIGLLVVLHAITLNWIPVATTAPVLAWVLYEYQFRSQGNRRSFDPDKIHHEDVLNRYVRQGVFKMIFHLVHFISFMYLAVITLIVI